GETSALGLPVPAGDGIGGAAGAPGRSSALVLAVGVTGGGTAGAPGAGGGGTVTAVAAGTGGAGLGNSGAGGAGLPPGSAFVLGAGVSFEGWLQNEAAGAGGGGGDPFSPAT